MNFLKLFRKKIVSKPKLLKGIVTHKSTRPPLIIANDNDNANLPERIVNVSIDENSPAFREYLITKGKELFEFVKKHDFKYIGQHMTKDDLLFFTAISFLEWQEKEKQYTKLLKDTSNVDIRKCPSCQQDWPHPSVTSDLKCPRCKKFALRAALQEAISIIDICDGLSPCGYHYGEQKWYHGEKCGVLVAERLRKILYD